MIVNGANEMNDYRKFIAIVLSCLCLSVVITLIIIYFTAKADWKGDVVAFDWHREHDVERYQFIGGNCWFRGCEPARAYNQQYKEEIHHWNRRRSGETCSTDSKGKRSCTTNYTSYPVYETKVYYTINDWRLGRIVKTDGNDNKNVYWNPLNLNQCDNTLTPGIGENDPLLNCEREGKQRELFYINIRADLENIYPAHCSIAYTRWSDMSIGFNVSGSYWIHQNLIDCEGLKYG